MKRTITNIALGLAALAAFVGIAYIFHPVVAVAVAIWAFTRSSKQQRYLDGEIDFSAYHND